MPPQKEQPARKLIAHIRKPHVLCERPMVRASLLTPTCWTCSVGHGATPPLPAHAHAPPRRDFVRAQARRYMKDLQRDKSWQREYKVRGSGWLGKGVRGGAGGKQE